MYEIDVLDAGQRNFASIGSIFFEQTTAHTELSLAGEKTGLHVSQLHSFIHILLL